MVTYAEEMARRGRPPKEDRSEVRGNRLPNIRVTDDELTLLESGAETDEQPLTTWLRDLGLRRARLLKKRHDSDPSV